jgi:hypothetical protein
MFSYEFTGRVCKNGFNVANAVCEALDACGSGDGRVTEIVAWKAATSLNNAGFDGGEWDVHCVLATVENCTFTKVG